MSTTFLPEPAPLPGATDKTERMWAMLCHLSSLCLYIGLPFGNLIAPLVIWFIQREKFPLVADQGKEVVNFQIT